MASNVALLMTGRLLMTHCNALLSVCRYFSSMRMPPDVLAAAVRNRSRDAMDRLIAAHAVSACVTLVTNNEAGFRDYPGLVIENWAVSL